MRPLGWTTASPASADPQSTIPTGGIPRVPPIDRGAASAAFITAKSKTAISTDPLARIPVFGKDMNRLADQADGGHFRTVADAVAVFAILLEQFFGGLSVQWCH
jgi:hypothetical protein